MIGLHQVLLRSRRGIRFPGPGDAEEKREERLGWRRHVFAPNLEEPFGREQPAERRFGILRGGGIEEVAEREGEAARVAAGAVPDSPELAGTTVRTAGRVAATFGAISAKTISNPALVDFGNAAGAATATHSALFDAASSGNMLYSIALTCGSQSIAPGTATSFAVGSLMINVGLSLPPAQVRLSPGGYRHP